MISQMVSGLALLILIEMLSEVHAGLEGSAKLLCVHSIAISCRDPRVRGSSDLSVGVWCSLGGDVLLHTWP